MCQTPDYPPHTTVLGILGLGVLSISLILWGLGKNTLSLSIPAATMNCYCTMYKARIRLMVHEMELDTKKIEQILCGFSSEREILLIFFSSKHDIPNRLTGPIQTFQINKNSKNKLGLNWAKHSSNWNWGLL